MVSTEAMLMAMYAGLYVYDSVLLLHPNEAILKAGIAKNWRSGFGSKYTTFAGKELYIPNLLGPAAPIFRLSWHYEASRPSKGAGWESCVQTLRWFQVPIWLLFTLSFLALPMALWGHFGDALLLVVFAEIYLCVVLILVLLYLAKKPLAMSNREYWVAAFELAICPPFAINVVRRLSLRQPVKEDFVAAARRLQKDVHWQETEIELRNRLIDEVSCEDNETPRAKALNERIALLTPVNFDDKP
jgi:hypothetical protein